MSFRDIFAYIQANNAARETTDMRMRTKTMTLAMTALAAIFLCGACGRRQGEAGKDLTAADTVLYAPRYATGFEILGFKGRDSRVIRVTKPWQGADDTAMELFISRNGETPPASFKGNVIKDSVRSIAAMSSSHVAFLSLIGETSKVRAVSGLRFISDENVREDNESVIDVGYQDNADLEALVAVSPDIVLLYGVSSSTPLEERLRELGLPYLYIGEYVEPHPLGKAEWVVALAELTGERAKGERAFSMVSENYERIRADAGDSGHKPKVMLNVPYGDTWFMPPLGSSMARLVEDAGGEYVYRENDSGKTEPIDIEKALTLVSKADFWLNTGDIRTLSTLKDTYPAFSKAKCVMEGNIYNCDKRLGPNGGNDFWEKGQVRPDLVLSDLARIFQGDSDSLYFYRKL